MFLLRNCVFAVDIVRNTLDRSISVKSRSNTERTRRIKRNAIEVIVNLTKVESRTDKMLVAFSVGICPTTIYSGAISSSYVCLISALGRNIGLIIRILLRIERTLMPQFQKLDRTTQFCHGVHEFKLLMSEGQADTSPANQ